MRGRKERKEGRGASCRPLFEVPSRRLSLHFFLLPAPPFSSLGARQYINEHLRIRIVTSSGINSKNKV